MFLDPQERAVVFEDRRVSSQTTHEREGKGLFEGKGLEHSFKYLEDLTANGRDKDRRD